MKTLAEVKAEMLKEAKEKPLGNYCILNRNGKILAHSAGEFEHIYTDDADLTWAKANGYESREEEMDDGRVLTFVSAKPKEKDMYQSADRAFYIESELPENEDDFVTEKHSAVQKAERNQRISDTDDFERLADITVQREEGGKRIALTDEEKVEVKEYRQALRDWPTVEGFPFVDFPEIPECIKYECEQKIKAREVNYGNY